MKALYIRVSTKEQNIARQERAGFDFVFVDYISGTVPLDQRPAGSDLVAGIKSGQIKDVFVKDIDRLGRDLRDILDTLDLFKKYNVVAHVETIGASHIDGKVNPVFQLMVGILGTVAQMEWEKINERTRQGREIAKIMGKYKGRKTGTTISRDKMLEKYNVEIKIIKKHNELSVKNLQKLTGRSRNLVTKLKKMI